MFKRIWLLLFTVFLLQSELSALTVTSLNIRWYGMGGDLGGQPEDETRDESLRDFLFNHLPHSDVFVFQEITNLEMLQEALFELNCQSYTPQIKPHQHVVICTQPYISQEAKANYDIQLERPRLRPALVSNLDLGVQVIGLHLKAGPRSWRTRQNQIEALTKTTRFLEKSIVIGDYNSYRKDVTGANEDDAQIFQQILGKKSFKDQTPNSPTYVSSANRIFDRVWTKGLKVQEAKVYGPCKQDSVQFPYSESDRYVQKISDHCAVQIKLFD